MGEVDWIGKKVFLRTCNNEVFQGKVIDETETKLKLIDKFGCDVELSKIDIKLCKEEF
jgi:hypothetical protein